MQAFIRIRDLSYSLKVTQGYAPVLVTILE